MSFDVYAAAGVAVLLLAALLYVLVASARRMQRYDGRLRLAEMLARQGAVIDIPPGEFACVHAALATRRCVLCREKAVCDAWLASGRREGFELFCPNAGFVAENAVRP